MDDASGPVQLAQDAHFLAGSGLRGRWFESTRPDHFLTGGFAPACPFRTQGNGLFPCKHLAEIQVPA